MLNGLRLSLYYLLKSLSAGGREVDLREVLNAIYYRADNGVKWRNLPSDFPAWQTVYTYFRTWVRLGVWEEINMALVKSVRQSVGREAEPSLTIIDSQSVKLGQKGGLKLEWMAIKRSKVASAILLWMSWSWS
jgi:transposase